MNASGCWEGWQIQPVWTKLKCRAGLAEAGEIHAAGEGHTHVHWHRGKGSINHLREGACHGQRSTWLCCDLSVPSPNDKHFVLA